MKLEDNVIDYQSFIYGASMNSQTIKSFEIRGLKVTRVITIENKANYLEYIDKNKDDNALVIYFAGFYSPVKRIFLQKICDFLRASG